MHSTQHSGRRLSASTTQGLEIPVLSSLPRVIKDSKDSPLAKCGCNKHSSHLARRPHQHLHSLLKTQAHSDHTSTCTAHSGARRTHQHLHSSLRCNQGATTGWYLSLALCFARRTQPHSWERTHMYASYIYVLFLPAPPPFSSRI
jgi:hypothetical protein